jgi:hypothetical protein
MIAASWKVNTKQANIGEMKKIELGGLSKYLQLWFFIFLHQNIMHYNSEL